MRVSKAQKCERGCKPCARLGNCDKSKLDIISNRTDAPSIKISRVVNTEYISVIAGGHRRATGESSANRIGISTVVQQDVERVTHDEASSGSHNKIRARSSKCDGAGDANLIILRDDRRTVQIDIEIRARGEC